MDKIIAIALLLFVQPVFGYILWFAVDTAIGQTNLTGWLKVAAVFVIVAILYAVFCFFFARGFLSSAEAKRLGF